MRRKQLLSSDAYNQAQKYNIFLFSASGKKNRPSGKAGKKLKNK